MKPYVWKEGMSEKEMREGAYWERNMLALLIAVQENDEMSEVGIEDLPHGWYYHGEWEGWSRVISLYDGKYTFHVPDDFDMGVLQQIEPNWDGHSTGEKWESIMQICGCKSHKQH